MNCVHLRHGIWGNLHLCSWVIITQIWLQNNNLIFSLRRGLCVPPTIYRLQSLRKRNTDRTGCLSEFVTSEAIFPFLCSLLFSGHLRNHKARSTGSTGRGGSHTTPWKLSTEDKTPFLPHRSHGTPTQALAE